MRKLLGLLVLVPTLLAAGNAQARVQYVYLGGAWDLNHCAQIAGANNFGYATLGGYVNGIYYWNACFGSDYRYPQPNPGPGTDPAADRIEDAVQSLRLSSLLLRTTLLNVDDGFAGLTPYAQAFGDNLDYLRQAVDDDASLLVIRRRFERVSESFGLLENKYIELYRDNSNRDIESAWDGLEADFVALAELLR
jgi:hypothetical protein